MTPAEIILTAVNSASKRDYHRQKLQEYCQELHDWSQEKIRLMKNEVALLETATDIGSRSVIQLEDIYKLMLVFCESFMHLT